MKGKILVTDSLFIFDEHVKKLEAAGFEVERLDKPEATEAELIEAVKGKVGYILGGIEHVTEKVIEAADELKAISFTGADYQHYLDAWKLAIEKGITITNTPGATTDAVSEMTLTLILIMTRDMMELSRIGSETFKTVLSIQDLQFGIVGLGHIGSKVARILKLLGAKKVVYWDRTRKESKEKELGIEYVTLPELFKNSDVITNHVSSNAGTFINGELISKTKDDVIFINSGAPNNFDYDAVLQKLTNSHARMALDVPKVADHIKELPIDKVFYTNINTGFNTKQCLQLMSDMATQSMINVLTKGHDEYVVKV